MRVKICGITNGADARVAVDCGADAIGVILVSGTPRYVGDRIDEVCGWLSALGPFVCRVAVCRAVEDLPDAILSKVDAVQYYDGGAAPMHWPLKRLRVVRLGGRSELRDVESAAQSADAVVVDAYHPELLGGTGASCDWRIAAEAVGRSSAPVVLAGGLTPSNVHEAILAVRPYAVDVSSGVETSPGRKDHALVRTFIRRAKAEGLGG